MASIFVIRVHQERLSTGSKKHKSFLSIFVPAVFLLSATVFFGSALIITDHKERFSAWKMVDALLRTKYRNCQDRCLPKGSEALPRGIAASTSDFQMRPLWGTPSRKRPVMNLLAMTVGTKQKANADKIVKKFLSSRFVVMLFHYDGNVDDWRDLEWCDHVIHVSAINQTKWWFAKRFLHPDIVSEYPYIFLWDEDLGIEHFDVGRYLSIVKKEGLEISQPALDPVKSEIHHQLTARVKGAVVHRTSNVVLRNGKKCDVNSTEPPCAGFVEMMAPVFSRASWRCTWYLIQNDFVHGWGMDYMLGYCAQGDRMKNIGIVDSEYVIHGGVPTLGGTEEEVRAAQKAAVSPKGKLYGERALIRKQQVVDQDRFKRRWNKAIEQDECWVDPYSQKSEFKR